MAQKGAILLSARISWKPPALSFKINDKPTEIDTKTYPKNRPLSLGKGWKEESVQVTPIADFGNCSPLRILFTGYWFKLLTHLLSSSLAHLCNLRKWVWKVVCLHFAFPLQPSRNYFPKFTLSFCRKLILFNKNKGTEENQVMDYLALTVSVQGLWTSSSR